MLLDVEHFYGEHEGRLGPMLIFLLIGFAPLLIYVYYSMWYIVPIQLFAVIWIIYFLRCAMIIPGDEKTRLENFKKQSNDIYASLYEMLKIKTIHPDGCIEFRNGRIAYIVIAYNGSTANEVNHSIVLRKFQSLLVGDHNYDIGVQNITDMEAMETRYSNVKLFVDPEAAKDFTAIIDHNRNIVRTSSLLTRIVYEIKGTRSEYKEMRDMIDSAIKSTYSRVFKTVYRVQDVEEIESILSRDIDGIIRFDELLRQKYCTKEYFKSKVLGYDDSEVAKPEEKAVTESNTFHVLYEEDSQ